MKKTTILIIVVLFMVIGYAAYNTTINIYGNGKLAENLSDFKVYLSNLKVNGKEISGINNTKDEFTINDVNGDVSVDVINDSTEYDTESYLECELEKEETNKIWTYDYTGGEQTFTVPTTGTYKLETWGAQGGYAKSSDILSGYGGYSVGEIDLKASDYLYINVGGQGENNLDPAQTAAGGYNGGGTAAVGNVLVYSGGGGGATHIAKTSGLLSTLENKKDDILIVSGGGGPSGYFLASYGLYYGYGGSGGGFKGNDGTSEGTINVNTGGLGGTQTTGYAFGQGQTNGNFAGGGGFYGGTAKTDYRGGGGGSGYIGNSLLKNKAMYCYNCTESSEEAAKTISTTCVSPSLTAKCAKTGNGYALITLLLSVNNIATDKVTITAQESVSQNMESISGKSITCKLKVNKISRTEVKYAKQYIYDRGIKDTNFTDVTCGAFENNGSCTVGENSITITNPSRPYSNAYIITTKKVDLTNFKTLNFNLKTNGTNRHHFITIRTSPLTDNGSYFDTNSTLLERIPIGYNGIFSVDISKIKESVYISLCQRQSTNDTTSSTAVVNQIWLE